VLSSPSECLSEQTHNRS